MSEVMRGKVLVSAPIVAAGLAVGSLLGAAATVASAVLDDKPPFAQAKGTGGSSNFGVVVNDNNTNCHYHNTASTQFPCPP